MFKQRGKCSYDNRIKIPTLFLDSFVLHAKVFGYRLTANDAETNPAYSLLSLGTFIITAWTEKKIIYTENR